MQAPSRIGMIAGHFTWSGLMDIKSGNHPSKSGQRPVIPPDRRPYAWIVDVL